MNLFNYEKEPLAYKYRPEKMEEVYGQEKIKKILSRMLEKETFISSIFYGPSGTGKTTVARVIAKALNYEYEYLNATKCSKQDVLDVANKAKARVNKTILFLDEIHRFNKLQQDSLLEDLENGNIVLIGATSENPYYSVNRALLSRVSLFSFKPLSSEDIFKILERVAIKENLNVRKEILEYISNFSGGDARSALNLLETLSTSDMLEESLDDISEIFGIKTFADKYDAISAMIKSIRGSDPDAAVYWMSKLLVGGEDPMYVARRLVIIASEDVGLANNNAISVAVSCMNGVKEIGMPEARILLSHCAIYLALSPKSNSAYLAVNKAMDLIEQNGSQEVPVHLTRVGAKEYKYPHDYENNYVKQDYLNKKIRLYTPGDNKFEKQMEEIWDKIRKGKIR